MKTEYTIKEEQDGMFGVYDQDDDCVEKGFGTRESAQEAIDEYEAGDRETAILSDALDLAIDHVQKNLPDLDVEEVKRLLADGLRG